MISLIANTRYANQNQRKLNHDEHCDHNKEFSPNHSFSLRFSIDNFLKMLTPKKICDRFIPNHRSLIPFGIDDPMASLRMHNWKKVLTPTNT